ncbi:hypothetical protein U1Q18_049455, partial [Sarracenia purpurea var. burkii]
MLKLDENGRSKIISKLMLQRSIDINEKVRKCSKLKADVCRISRSFPATFLKH